MSTFAVGYVSSVALFAMGKSRGECEAAIAEHEVLVEGFRELSSTVLQKLCARFDLELQVVIRSQKAKGVSTLRMDRGYGWAEYHKNWLKFGCEALVEEHELAEAARFVSGFAFQAAFDERLFEAGFDFTFQDLNKEMFDEVSSKFSVQYPPECV